jgi:cytochrome c oxidase cbb3-type subunit III
MADFNAGFWSLYVAGLTLVSILACLLLLWVTARKKVPATADNTTGHVWDEDLTEMNNPLPRWWMWLFVITIVFSAIYLAFYPGLGTFGGTLKWTSVNQYEAEQERARVAMAPVYAQFVEMDAEQLSRNPQAMGIGQRLFLNNCAQCHGSDARGSRGFPDLTDRDFLGGDSHDYIKTVIQDGRTGVMPPLAAALGTADDVRNMAHYVLSLSGSPHNSAWAQLARPQWGVCAACHGAEGKGNQALGAPNLTDRTWLHGWGERAIANTITNGINNVMPAQGQLLTPEQIHVLGAYVWGLSQGTAVAAGGN